MSCNIKHFNSPATGDESKLSKELFKRLNNNATEVSSIYGTVTDPSFAEWAKTNHNITIDVDNADGRSIPNIIKLARAYQDLTEFRIRARKDNTNTKYRIFETVDMERHAVLMLGDYYLMGEDFLKNKDKPISRFEVRKFIISNLANHLKKNTDLSDNQIKYVQHLMQELRNENSSLLDIVLASPKVTKLKRYGKLSDDILAPNVDEAITNADIMLDEAYAKDWSDSIGETRLNEQATSKEIKRAISLVRKVNSVERSDGASIYDYDKNTYSGIAETINFGEIEQTIKTMADKTDVQSFVDSLYDIARTMPGMMSITVIADRASANPNYANTLFVQLAQPIVNRTQYSASETAETVRTSNTNSSPALVLRDTIISNMESILYVNMNPITNLMDIARHRINQKRFNDEIKLPGYAVTFDNVSHLLADIFNRLNIGVKFEIIENYIKNGDGTLEERISSVHEDARNIASALEEMITNNRTNKEIISAIRRKWYKDVEVAQQMGTPIPERPVIPEDQLVQVRSTKTTAKIMKLANKYSLYQNVKVELNSKNINGDLVGDVIKNSFLTKFFQRMDNEVAALDYLSSKAKLSQYSNSNILVERVDSKGNIIPGLLRSVNGEYQLTPYYKFLAMELFDGTQNATVNKSVDYGRMTPVDFDITAVGMFQNASHDREQNYSESDTGGFTKAKYFIQTPSDAPKTFAITSYRLNIDGLFNEDNTLNHTHPIFVAMKNIMLQEYNNMKQAFAQIVELDEQNNIVYETNQNNQRYGKPKFRDVKLYDNYHIKNGSPIDKQGNLVGNVFEFWDLAMDLNGTNEGDNFNVGRAKDIESMHTFLYGGLPDINSYLNSYITTKANEAVEYFEQHKDNIKGYTTDLIREFALNYTIQYTNFTQLFSGNPKFYKDGRDKIKRDKEVQGSGLIYSAYTVDDKLANENNPIGKIVVGDKTITVGRKFNYATMTNVIKPSDPITVDNIVKRLKKGNTPEHIINFIKNKYTSLAKVDDAQSYITLDEAVRRIWMSGQYEEYRDLIEALYDESKPVNTGKLNKFMQVAKNFYYDLQYDAEIGLDVPVQIKNAEFILIPRFLKGTDLHKVAELMTEFGLDQLNTVETEKAAINKKLTLFDNAGQITNKTLKDFRNNVRGNTKVGNYSSLYKQQDTPQHMDDFNKLGLQIQKKILDNLKGVKGEETRKRIFDIMINNIEESFDLLTDELGVSKNEDGTIKFNDDGTIYNVDPKAFYEMIAKQLALTGADSNMMEYARLNELTNIPNMPSYMPIIRKKMMSVFQSVFTNNVTRQEFPGFHAPAVAGTGFKRSDILASSEVEGFPKLKYNADGNGVAEILIPRWMQKMWTKYDADGNIIQEFTIEDIQAAGLDTMIGYRIPTEGKQSIFLMKVVGFLPEAYGSTIVMPDEVVTQSGMDFDIDTIYAMYHNSYINKRTGELKKVEYSKGDDDLTSRYIKYVNKFAKGDKVNTDKIADETKDAYREYIEDLNKESSKKVEREIKRLIGDETKYYNAASDTVKSAIQQVDRQIKDSDSSITYREKLNLYIGAIDQVLDDETYGFNKKGGKELKEHLQTIAEAIDLQKDFNEAVYQSFKENVGSEIAEAIKDAVFKNAEARAKGANIMSFDKFSNLSETRQNSREARQNELLDTYIEVMSDANNAEENFMSSNFDDIKAAKSTVLGHLDKEWIDTNSFIGQASYRAQVMSGAILKGISVFRDGFLSVSNVSKTTLVTNFAPEIIYNLNNLPYNIKELEQNYGTANVKAVENNNVSIRFTNLGWSFNGNRNIDGKLITPYSSETTALILDGVKEGGVFNVNIFTFPVFKTFVDLGIDYETAIAFIAQPGISEAIAVYNDLNSVFNTNSYREIGAAYRSILNKYMDAQGIKYNKFAKTEELVKLSGLQISDRGLLLDKEALISTAARELNYSDKDAVINQLQVLNQFGTLNQLAVEIGNHARVMNSDKFGAGQSLFESNKILEDVVTLKDKTTPILYSEAGATTLIDAVYPNINFGTMNISQSVYPTLYAQLKYSTLASIQITSPMFRTEHSDFLTLKSMLPKKSNENTVFRFENHIIGLAMQESIFLNDNSVTYDGKNVNATSTDFTGLENRRRISGYLQPILYDFDFKDFSEDNVGKFMMLSPANKIFLLKNAVKEGSLLDYIEPQLKDGRKEFKGLSSPHTLKVRNDTVNPEEVYEKFRDMVESDNVFVKLAAKDLIRYAAVIENLRYGFGTVSRIIPAEYLYGNVTNLTSHTTAAINRILTTSEHLGLIDDFFAKNSDLDYIPKYENRAGNRGRGVIEFNVLGQNVAKITLEVAEYVGLVEQYETDVDGTRFPIYKRYIKTNIYTKGVKRPELNLYKVVQIGEDIWLHPMNTFERYDIGSISVNPDNIRQMQPGIYSKLIKAADVGEVAIPFKLNELDKARNKVGRRFVQMPAYNTAAGSSFFDRYMSLVSEYEITKDKVSPPVERGSTVKIDTSSTLSDEAYEAIVNSMSLDTKFIFKDSPYALALIKSFENNNYTNYVVVGENTDSETNKFINLRNIADKKTLAENKLNSIENFIVKLNTSDAAYKTFYQMLEPIRVGQGVLHSAEMWGAGYLTLPTLATQGINLLEYARAIVNVNGTDYLVTNLGKITDKTYKQNADYVANPIRRDYIDQVVKGSFDTYKFTNLIRVENLADVVRDEALVEEFESSIEEVDATTAIFINNTLKGIESSLRSGDDKLTKEVRKKFAKLSLLRNNKESMNHAAIHAALSTSSLYIEQRSIYLRDKFNRFYTDETGKSYKIDDPALFDILQGNDALEEQFTKLMLSLSDVLQDGNIAMGMLEYDLDTAEYEEERQFMIEANALIGQIKQLYSGMAAIKARANAARDYFFDTLAKKLSTNPNIQAGLQSVLKGNRDESFFQQWLVTASESNLSLTQIVLSKAMRDIHAAKIEGEDKVDKFNADLAKIEEMDSSVSIGDVISDSHKLEQAYNEEFLNEKAKKRRELDLIKLEKGTNSIEFMNAANDYFNNFMATNTEQPLVQEYYKELNAVYHLLDKFPNSRIKLKELQDRRSNISDRALGGDYSKLSEADRLELREIYEEELELASMIDIDGNYKPTSVENAAVNEYLTRTRAIQSKYKDSEIKEEFNTRVKEARNKISYYEKTMTSEQLSNSEDYKEAKNWLAYNSYTSLEETFDKELKAAYDVLKEPNEEQNKDLKNVFKNKYDNEGVVDGNKFEDNQIKMVKASHTRGQTSQTIGEGVERLIRNQPPVEERNKIYATAFYRSMRNTARDKEREQTIRLLNDLLGYYFNPQTGIIETYAMSYEELDEMTKLFDNLQEVDSMKEFYEDPQEALDAKQRRRWIRNNVKFNTNEAEYNRQRQIAENKGPRYLAAWEAANSLVYETEDGVWLTKINNYIYGYVSPKEESKWLDRTKTEAKKFINDNVEYKPTKYYHQRQRLELEKGAESYTVWKEANHYFDEFAKQWKPIRIWTQRVIKDESKVVYNPRSKWLTQTIKDEYKNPNHVEGETKFAENRAETKYRNQRYVDIQSNPAKKAMYELVNNTMNELALDKKNRRLVQQGALPYESIDPKKQGIGDYWDSFKNAFGWYDTVAKSEEDNAFDSHNVTLPMLYRSRQTELLPKRQKLEGETDAEYAAYLRDRNEKNDVIRKDNDKFIADNANKNYKDVFGKFIIEATNHNARQKTGRLLKLTLAEIQAMDFMKKNSKGNYIYDRTMSRLTGERTVSTEHGSNSAKKFEHQMRKLLLNEYEVNQGVATKISRLTRNLTSSKFMWMNLTGGLNNVMYGMTQVFMESIAREFMSQNDYNKALREYTSNITSYFANYNKEHTTNLTDGLIKLFNVIELDAVTEVATENKVAKETTALLYFQQSAGEHFMQHSTMLGLLYSHRVYEDAKGKVRAIPFNLYARERRELTLRNILAHYDSVGDTKLVEKLDTFINGLKLPGNETELDRYLTFKGDILSDFLLTIPKNSRGAITKELGDRTKELKTEFEALPTFREQFELRKGRARLKADSKLSNEDIGKLRYKAINVNYQIHGIYDKTGANKWQSTWHGGIAMQFHKHIIPGWAKRWGYSFGKGIYNEARENVQKGMYISVAEFLATPFTKRFKNTVITNEMEAIEGYRVLHKSFLEFYGNVSMYYNILPEYEKANIRRTIAEFAGIVAALCLFIGARLLYDEDDDETQIADYMMYQSDRLASELQQYMIPFGVVQEAQKLYQNPVASFATAKQALTMSEAIMNYWITGDSDNLMYKTGTNSGENKISYNLQKQIPVWSQWMKHKRLGKNNSYFRLGNNIIGIVPIRDIVDDMKK